MVFAFNLETQDKDLEKLNRGKVGAPYVYPECLMVFLAYLHVLLNIDYRGLKGFLRVLSRLISFDVPDYTTICRRVNKVAIEKDPIRTKRWWFTSTLPARR